MNVVGVADQSIKGFSESLNRPRFCGYHGWRRGRLVLYKKYCRQAHTDGHQTLNWHENVKSPTSIFNWRPIIIAIIIVKDYDNQNLADKDSKWCWNKTNRGRKTALLVSEPVWCQFGYRILKECLGAGTEDVAEIPDVNRSEDLAESHCRSSYHYNGSDGYAQFQPIVLNDPDWCKVHWEVQHHVGILRKL